MAIVHVCDICGKPATDSWKIERQSDHARFSVDLCEECRTTSFGAGVELEQRKRAPARRKKFTVTEVPKQD